MTVADKMNGPIWILWGVLIIFLILTIIFLFGFGSGLIAGYNTASKEKQDKYDKKKLCRVMGYGMAAISILIFILIVFANVLPANFIYIFVAAVIIVCIAIIVLTNTICKKR